MNRAIQGPVAAIGIGSNSVRLLVAERLSGRTSAVERMETVTRLASYRVAAGGARYLADDAMRATLAAADNFAQHARRRGATLVGVLATEAVRVAENRMELIEPLETHLGVPVTVIGGEEEVALGWRTITSGYEEGANLGVIDIGGASTGLSVGTAGSELPADAASLKLGARTAMLRFRLDRPTPPDEVASAVTALSLELGRPVSTMQPPPEIAVVIGGTATVLAGVKYNSLDGDTWTDALVDRPWLAGWLERIAPLDLDGRTAARVPLDLADVAVAGGAILLAVLDAWHLRRFYVSQKNILDGFIQGIHE